MKTTFVLFVLVIAVSTLSILYFMKYKKVLAHPMLIASNLGNLDQVKHFIENEGIDVNYLQEPFGTALHQAALGGYIEVVHYLITSGADVNAKLINGNTPLFNASLRGNRDHLIKLLLEHGAEVQHADNDGVTALFNAVTIKKNLKTIKLLVEAGADVNRVANNGGTPLLNAAILADRKAVAYLIEHGAKSVTGANQTMPLHVAAERGNLAIVKLLVDRGDYHNVVMKNNIKPVDLARTNQHGEVVQFLERL